MQEQKIFVIGDRASTLSHELSGMIDGMGNVNMIKIDPTEIKSNSGWYEHFVQTILTVKGLPGGGIRETHFFMIVSDDQVSISIVRGIMENVHQDSRAKITLFCLGVDLENAEPRSLLATRDLFNKVSSNVDTKIVPFSYHSVNELIQDGKFAMLPILAVIAKWIYGFMYPLLNETRPSTTLSSVYSTLFPGNDGSYMAMPSFGEGTHSVKGVSFSGGYLGVMNSKWFQDSPIVGSYVVSSDGCNFDQFKNHTKSFKYTDEYKNNCFVTLPNNEESVNQNLITTIAVNTPLYEDFIKKMEAKIESVTVGSKLFQPQEE